ncbi:hypothetical protein BH11PSE2_BH11PSE2_05080 [soil metagenome]
MFGHQSLDAELKVLAEKYGPPAGRTLLVKRGDEVLAAGAIRDLGEGICELKRLYVRDAAKGMGVGRRLSEALMTAARDDGFTVVRLDTGNLLVEATRMYESLGFTRRSPYLDYPERLLPYLVFMERQL